MHHQEVPDATAGQQRPGLRRRVEAAAQRKAPHRHAHLRPPGGTIMQPVGRDWCASEIRSFVFPPTTMINVVTDYYS